jgi:succinylglutamic semialdehyde dehydrogenase
VNLSVDFATPMLECGERLHRRDAPRRHQPLETTAELGHKPCHQRAFIDRKRIVAGQELISTEPATGAILWQGMAGDASTEVAAARAGWHEWAARPLAYRIEALRRFANVVRGRHEAFADLIARETGKPLWEARTEVDTVIAKVDISVTAFSERTGQRRIDAPMGSRLALRHKPHGVLAVLGPYNFPAHLPNGHIVPALLAGNAVVFKPSEKTPATGAFLVDCYRAAGIPEASVRLLLGGPDEGRALASHPDIDGLLFTGSARTGLALNRAFAETPEKILALEMGGNNPIVVWATPDIYTAAVLVIQSAFTSAGQRCTAARRLIVDQTLYEPLIEQVNALAGRLIIGEPHADPAPFMGPVIDNEVADMLTESFLELSSLGGRPIRYLQRPVEGRPFLTPGIIDMTDARKKFDIELFGPILQVIRVDSFEAAIAEANDTRYGLSASLISQQPKLYDQFWANIRAGIVNWNKPTNGASSSAPFGGVGWSGNHRPSAYYAADYCAFPVVSSETEQARASIGIGLRES